MKTIYLPLVLIACFLFSNCIRPKEPYASLAPGIWRGALQLDPNPKLPIKEEIKRYEKEGSRPDYDPGTELPFLFEVSYPDNPNQPLIEIINGSERIKVEDVFIGRNRATAEDTIYIHFPIYDTHIRGIVREGIIEGEWTVRFRNNYSIPFYAHYGKKDRFILLPEKPNGDLTGKWECTFDLNLAKTSKAIGEFVQSGSQLSGTFRTETGDYRYLDGTITGDRFYLSTFDGTHAYLFYGKISGDSLIGTYKSGKHFLSVFNGYRNSNFELRDPTKLTQSTGKVVDFNFLQSNGSSLSISDPSLKGKAKILQIMGTWCPNCYDETRFLTEYLLTNPSDNLAIIGLACERYKDTLKSLAAIKSYKEKMKVTYPILLASNTTAKNITSKNLPFLDSIIGYPTMVFLDKNNIIQKIHTGIDGPATSNYAHFKKEFQSTVAELIKSNK